MSLRRRGLGPHDRFHERLEVLLQRLHRERLLAYGCVHDAALVHPELDLAGLQLFDRPSHVHGHGPRLRVGHQAAGAEHLAEGTELPPSRTATSTDSSNLAYAAALTFSTASRVAYSLRGSSAATALRYRLPCTRISPPPRGPWSGPCPPPSASPPRCRSR